ncbi:MAG: ABC transporter permease, partial [Actinomycetota bacterium]|nr:ABC transporter permease [Actinomycetota bacterium]
MTLFLHQLRSEQLIFWRSREAAMFVFLLPVLLFVLLAAVYSGDVAGEPARDYLLVGMVGYGIANTAFGGVAIFLVLRREAGILKRIRATPLPLATYLAAVLVSTLVVFAVQAVVLVVLGRLVYGAQLPDRPGSLVLALALGAIVFAAMGVAASARSLARGCIADRERRHPPDGLPVRLVRPARGLSGAPRGDRRRVAPSLLDRSRA